MIVVNCSFKTHAAEILDIFNEVISHSTALYDYQPRTMETMKKWFKLKTQGDYPVIGVVDDTGKLLGFGSYGIFRAWPAYKYTIEHSVYVHKDARGNGVGKLLLQQLTRLAVKQNYHVMVGCIDQTNKASIALHLNLGFVHAGTVTQAAFKFGRWLDLGFYQLTLATPEDPVED